MVFTIIKFPFVIIGSLLMGAGKIMLALVGIWLISMGVMMWAF